MMVTSTPHHVPGEAPRVPLWTTLQYMAGEVQYGSRTDNIDCRLFMAYTEAWLSANTLASTFSFSPDRPLTLAPYIRLQDP